MVKKGLLLALMSLSFVGSSVAIEKGPADESAYWILKFHGRLLPVTVLSTRKIVFAQTEVGREATAEVKITNKGYGDLVIKKIYLQKGEQFHIKSTTCTKPLNMNESCRIVVSFKPTQKGPFGDTLNIATNDPNVPIYSVELEGSAVFPIVSGGGGEVTAERAEAAPSQQPVEEKEKRTTKRIKSWEVKPCDTLWDIAASVYGDPLLWAAIYDANSDKIGDPWIIEVGTVLKIPELNASDREKYREMSLQIMQEMADRPLGPKCPVDYEKR